MRIHSSYSFPAHTQKECKSVFVINHIVLMHQVVHHNPCVINHCHTRATRHICPTGQTLWLTSQYKVWFIKIFYIITRHLLQVNYLTIVQRSKGTFINVRLVIHFLYFFFFLNLNEALCIWTACCVAVNLKPILFNNW